MKRFLVWLFVTLSMLVLAGCIIRSDENTYISELVNTPYMYGDALAELKPWQSAYATLLCEYEGMVIGEYAEMLMEEIEVFLGGKFTLFDIDGNGTPELIIWAASQGAFFNVYSAYTFDYNAIIPLEIIGSFGGRGPSVFSPGNDMPGMITTIAESGFTRYTLIEMEGHSLKAPISIYEDWTGTRSGDGSSLYFVRGVEVTPMEIHDGLCRYLFDCCCVRWREERGLFYTLVEHDEFYRVLEEVFGIPSANEDIIWGEWPHEITEENIQYVIFGVDSP